MSEDPFLHDEAIRITIRIVPGRYMGAGVSFPPREDETWRRGRDLNDGRDDPETFLRIASDIEEIMREFGPVRGRTIRGSDPLNHVLPEFLRPQVGEQVAKHRAELVATADEQALCRAALLCRVFDAHGKDVTDTTLWPKPLRVAYTRIFDMPDVLSEWAMKPAGACMACGQKRDPEPPKRDQPRGVAPSYLWTSEADAPDAGGGP